MIGRYEFTTTRFWYEGTEGLLKIDLKTQQGITIVDQHTGKVIEIVFDNFNNREGIPTLGKARVLVDADQQYIILREGQSLEDKLATLDSRNVRQESQPVGSFDDDFDEYEDRPGYFDYMLGD